MANVFDLNSWIDARNTVVEFLLNNRELALAAGLVGLVVWAVRKWKRQRPSAAAEAQEEEVADVPDPEPEQQDQPQIEAPPPAPYRAPIPPPADWAHGQPDDDLSVRKMRPLAGQQ